MSQSKKRTLVLGASPNPARYSHMAGLSLSEHGHEVVAVGRRAGQVGEIEILPPDQLPGEVDTITLYLNPTNQRPYYDYILQSKARRIIFNPGTENPELIRMAREAGIETEIACTLVLLAMDSY